MSSPDIESARSEILAIRSRLLARVQKLCKEAEGELETLLKK